MMGLAIGSIVSLLVATVVQVTKRRLDLVGWILITLFGSLGGALGYILGVHFGIVKDIGRGAAMGCTLAGTIVLLGIYWVANGRRSARP